MDEQYDEDDLSLADSQEGLGSSASLHRGDDAASGLTGSSSLAGGSAGFARRPLVGSFRTFLLSSAVGEFVATFFLVFLGVSAIYAANFIGDDALSTGSLLMAAIGYGFAYGCLVYAFSFNAGGYVPSIRQMNPALTLALYLLGKLDAVKAGVLVIAQASGAILSTGILFLCYNGHSLRVFELYDGTNIWQRLMMSILVSFLFCFVVIITNFAVAQPVLQQGVSTDTSEQSPQTVHELNSLISSLVSVIGVAIGTPLTGCFMNPLFGLTVLTLSHWYNSAIVVVVGPTLGALLATLTAKLFTYRTRAPFLTGVRWGQGGLGGLGLGNLPPTQQMSAVTRMNPFNPAAGGEEKQGSRF